MLNEQVSGAASDQRLEIGFGNAAGAMDVEPMFLDEPFESERPAPKDAGPSPLDLFPDENDPSAWDTAAAQHQPAPPSATKRSVNLLAIFFLVVAAMAFTTVRAYQVNAAGLHQASPLPGR